MLGVTPEQVFRATLEHMTGVTPQQVFVVIPELEKVFGVTLDPLFGVTPEQVFGVIPKHVFGTPEHSGAGVGVWESLQNWSSCLESLGSVVWSLRRKCLDSHPSKCL